MSSTTTIGGATNGGPEPLAPLWHTAALVGLTVSVAVAGSLLAKYATAPALPLPDRSSRIVAVYLPMLVVQASLLLYVCRIARPRNALLALIGERWRSAERALGDVALAIGGCLVIEALELVFVHFQGAPGVALLKVLPDSALERVTWIVVAVSVGFSEEVVYRGYLRVQLAAFTGSVGLGIALQGLLFGMAHGEQGFGAALRFSAYGMGLGWLAVFRRSLIPGILCHVGIDVAAGLLRGG